MAQGIDGSRVEDRSGEKRITQQADFNEDTIEESAIMGAIEVLAERGGLEMRNLKLGMMRLNIAVVYADGVRVEGSEKVKRLLITDREIMTTACAVYHKTVNRRIRIRSIGLCFEELASLGYQPDLFEPEMETKNRTLQEAVDKIQNRYGTGAVMRGMVLAASHTNGGKRLLTAGTGFAN